MRSFQHPKSHFDRSREHLQNGTLSSLFYAALEFRYAVEARLSEYAERANEINNKHGNVWKVKDLAKHVNKAFGSDDQTYRIEINAPRLEKPVIVEYTPITKEVRSALGKIDNFLHYEGVLQCTIEGKEEFLRSLLSRGLEELEKCLSGGMQGPLIREKDGRVSLMVSLEKHPELQMEQAEGEHWTLHVTTHKTDD